MGHCFKNKILSQEQEVHILVEHNLHLNLYLMSFESEQDETREFEWLAQNQESSLPDDLVCTCDQRTKIHSAVSLAQSLYMNVMQFC